MYILDTCLWVIGSILCAAALLTGLARKRFDQLPAFSFYLGISALTNPVGIVIRSPWLYEWFVFSVSMAGFVVEVAVIYELANRLFLSRSPFDKIFRTAPRWSTAALFLVVSVLGALLPQHARTMAMRAYSTSSFSLNLMDLGLLVTLFLCTRLLGISWGVLRAGAALGIGVTDAGCAAGAVLLAQFGPRYLVDFVRLGSFDVAGLVWLCSVCMPETKVQPGETRPQISELTVGFHEAEQVSVAVKRRLQTPN
jgi:hypothetical protein